MGRTVRKTGRQAAAAAEEEGTAAASAAQLEALRVRHEAELRRLDGVCVDAHPLYDRCPYGARTEIPVLVNLRAGALPADQPREPLSLCVVLDRSGSMRGALPQCKEAIEEVVQMLQDEDTLHLVVYDDKVHVVFEGLRACDADRIREHVAAVEVRGTTNLMGGITRGVEVLGRLECTGTRALFLFSDGLPNVGVRDAETIGRRTKELCEERGVVASTFGIGARYDAKLMGSIAKAGGGSYFYIDDAERIPSVVRRGICGITRYWAREATLTAQGAPGTGTSVTAMSHCKDLLRPKVFAVREFAFHQYLITVEASGEASPEQPLTLEIDFECTEAASGERSRQRLMVRLPRVAASEMRECEPNRHTAAYLKCLELSEENNEVLAMIRDRRPAEEILAKKRRIVDEYERLAQHDPLVVLEPLLVRERELLRELEQRGVHTQAARKHADYVASKGHGYVREEYGYCDEEDDDDDMGFGLFY